MSIRNGRPSPGYRKQVLATRRLLAVASRGVLRRRQCAGDAAVAHVLGHQSTDVPVRTYQRPRPVGVAAQASHRTGIDSADGVGGCRSEVGLRTYQRSSRSKPDTVTRRRSGDRDAGQRQLSPAGGHGSQPTQRRLMPLAKRLDTTTRRADSRAQGLVPDAQVGAWESATPGSAATRSIRGTASTRSWRCHVSSIAAQVLRSSPSVGGSITCSACPASASSSPRR